jgi:hypothetical protein
MLTEQLIIRFLAGGVVVSLFSVFSDILKPKSFSGLFGAAPSVALATLALTINADGILNARIEARSMIAGAIAFLVYAWAANQILWSRRFRVLPVTAGLLVGWVAVALMIWSVIIR